MSEVLRPALGTHWVRAWRPSWGKSHLAPVHAMLHVESLSKSARVPQTERTTDSPILSRGIFYVDSHARPSRLSAQVGARDTHRRVRRHLAARSPQAVAKRLAPPRECGAGGGGAGRGLAAEKWRRRPRAHRGPRVLVTAAPRLPSPLPCPRLSPAPARPVSTSLRSSGGGRLARSLVPGGSGTCRATLPTTPPPGVRWRAGEGGPGPGPRCWTAGICPARVSPAASIRQGCPVSGRGLPEGREPEGACGCTWQTSGVGSGSGRPGSCLPDAVAPRAAPGARGLVPRPGSVGKMATPGMSWQQHYYGSSAAKFAPSPAAAQQAGHSMDYSQDLHLKMSKKIAQLTKVRARQRGRHGWDPVRAAPGSGARLGGCAPSGPGRVEAGAGRGGGLLRGSNSWRLSSKNRSNFRGTLEMFIETRQLSGTAGFMGLNILLPFRGNPAQNKLGTTSFIAQQSITLVLGSCVCPDSTSLYTALWKYSTVFTQHNSESSQLISIFCC